MGATNRELMAGQAVQTRVDYLAGTTPIYTGYASPGVPSGSSSGWHIYKATFDGNSNPTLIQYAYGAWDNRASLNYS